NICRELALEPSGFVVLPEAVAHFIKSEEGVPLSAVVVEIGKEFLEIAIFKMGNLSGNTRVARSVSAVEDLSEGLSRFPEKDPLPSRVILYNGKEGELDEVKQALNEADWEKTEKVNFLHTPKVEVFSPEKKVLAVALAGGSEIGGVVAVDSGMKEEVSEENIEVPQSGLTAQELGFVIGEDVAPQPALSVPVKSNKMDRLGKIAKRIKKTMFGLFTKRPGKVKFDDSRINKVFKWGLVFLAVVMVLFFLFWWFYPKAVVRVYVSPKKFEEKADLSISLSASSLDLSKNIIPGKVLTSEVSGEKTKTATGAKKVGEKAKGSVTIRNGTKEDINFKAGTVLMATNDLKFTLTSSASISAALSTVDPGKQTVEVSAYDIGAEYNLAKDEIFKVANYPKADVDAVANSNFSGGSSRDILAISSEDQESLEDDLSKELSEKAKKDLLQNLSAEEFFIDSSLVTNTLSRVFSGKVGDEAENVKLTLDLEVKGYSVTKENLIEFSRKVLEESAPSGYVLRADQLVFAFEPSEEEKDVFVVRVIANFLPEVDSGALIKQIMGKDPNMVEKYLSSIAGFKGAKINIKPKFPGRLGTLPRISKNITLEVLGEK
ncbi:MAG: baseplate J/gp47 family protein, partial [bacterium]|nr:baseplate J/gp47 family protein [bacterium]